MPGNGDSLKIAHRDYQGFTIRELKSLSFTGREPKFAAREKEKAIKPHDRLVLVR